MKQYVIIGNGIAAANCIEGIRSADRDGRITVGTGSGFMYPPAVADLVRQGKTVSEAMDQVFGQKDIGHGQGAIGYLSRGLLERKALTEQSVTAAMVPRLNDSYDKAD